jgi:hypothetical protein
MHYAGNKDAWAPLSLRLAEVLLEPTMDKGEIAIPHEFKHIILDLIEERADSLEKPVKEGMSWLSDFLE